MKPNTIAIIPARGGSKAVPKKNIKFLCGKPLIAYTIEAALGSKFLNRTIVSTEDREIAEIATEYGAEVIKRPEGLATDFAPTAPVLEHVLRHLEKCESYRAEIIALLQPTSPLRNSQHLDNALEIFFKDKCDSLLSVCPSHAFLWRTSEGGAYPLNYDFKNRPRRQDKEPEYRENGAIYITKYEIIVNEHNFLGGKIGLYVMPEEKSLEIDNDFDFWVCEQLMNEKSG